MRATRTTPMARSGGRSNASRGRQAGAGLHVAKRFGRTVTLSSFKGKPVILYFYPRDNTSGCTTQACGIRDAWGEFEQAGAVVLGVSPDDVKSHVKFKNAFELPFPLLADTDHSVAEAYGTWVEKSRYGRTYMGIERSTFVIGSDGNVTRVMRNVQPATHADEVLAALA